MTMEHEARILIVDDRREWARVLRTSLDLQNRGYLITDVPSGEEAMLEFARFNFDLLITDYRLPGITGAQLIKRAQKMNPGIKAIVMTGQALDEVTPELEPLGVLGIFEKPFDVEAFTGRVDEIMFGAAETEDDRPIVKIEAAPVDTIEFNQQAVSREVSTLLMALGAEAVALINRTGRILEKGGSFSEAMCFPEIAVLLASNFTTTAEITTYIGTEPPSAMHYYAANWHDIYALTVGVDFFIAIVFPGGSQKQMGAVLRIGKDGAKRIAEVIYGEHAREVIPVEEPPAPKVEAKLAAQPVAEEPRRMSLVEEIRMQKRLEEEAKAREVMEEVPLPPIFAELMEEDNGDKAIDLDFDLLDDDLEGMGDFDNLWDESSLEQSASGTEALSMEEAMELGLITDMDE